MVMLFFRWFFKFPCLFVNFPRKFDSNQLIGEPRTQQNYQLIIFHPAKTKELPINYSLATFYQ